MQPFSFFSQRPRLLIFSLYFVSLCYLAFLVFSNQPGIFFSGDGGMKFMVVKQLQGGHGFKYLYLPQPAWVHEIWSKGFFPFRDPFIYPTPQGDLFSFPPYFQLISAKFYGWFGDAGLYVLPVVSAILLWGVMIVLLRLTGIPDQLVALLLAILVFCSPLTLYGAVYWEHMPAVLLLCAGIAVLLRPGMAVGYLFLLGLLSGLSVWLRPEAIAMNILFGVAALVMYRRERHRGIPWFLAGMAITMAGFLAMNHRWFGSLLGVHSFQVLQDHPLFYKIGKGAKNFFLINWISIRYFPLILATPIVLYQWWKGRIRLEQRTVLFLAVIASFCCLSPFMLPNDGGMQWGARYFLVVIPLFLVAIALVIKELGMRLPGWVYGVLVVALVYAFLLNSIGGGVYKLRQANFTRIKPAMEFLRQQQGDVIVVGSEFIPMELGSLFDEKYFFLSEKDSSFSGLHALLRQQHIREYLFINQEDKSPAFPNLLQQDGGKELIKKGNYYFARYAVPE
ncbi:hypothetical protein Q4E93_30915 [Flavitalea sp. BT771]|uniref:LA_3751/LA_3752 family putative glycosyltransferase n=1 Tax=Flavitalea sp. BT771 TaxID=3063329 RepID=UPI0026E30AB0|nr:hypothetical protein [Flavitalea sp. BT771]MDO6435067.1 hypothetical protein [Flavitalea sp. BT771]MDV6223967.1 hypothetical protein [Flavitalea sp. BT771]